MDLDFILGAGPLQEQATQTDQQLADLIARRRAYHPQHFNNGLATALGGIGDIIMGQKFNQGEQALRGRQTDLAKQMAGLRGQGLNAAMGTPMGPQAPPGMADNPPRVPLSSGDQGQLATAYELSGDPLMAKAGAGMLTRAQQAPKLALETEQARRAAEQNAALESPEGRTALRFLLQRFAPGTPVSEKTPSAILQGILPSAERGYAAEKQAEASRYRLAAMDNRFDVKTGMQEDQFKAKRLGELTGAINPMLPRGGLKNYVDTVNRAQKLGALLIDPATGQPKQLLTPQDMTEAAIALQQMVANGHASQSEVEALIPKSAGADTARLGQYFTGHPWDAKQQVWAMRMLHTAQREADTNRATILANIKQKIPQFGDVRQKWQPDYESILKGAGLNPAAFNEQGLPVDNVEMLLGTNPVLGGDVTGASPTKQAASPAGAHPQANAALEWAKKNPGDPRAVKILQALGLGQ